jgi:hypothetical protein
VVYEQQYYSSPETYFLGEYVVYVQQYYSSGFEALVLEWLTFGKIHFSVTLTEQDTGLAQPDLIFRH